MMFNKGIKNSSLALRPDSIYRTSPEDDKANPQDLFTKATRYLDTLRNLNDSAERENLFKKELNETLVHCIYGSNRIEHAGLGQEATFYLCRRRLNQGSVPTFDGRATDKTGIEELLAVDQSLRQIPEKELLRQGREVVQHLQAFEYLNHHFVEGGEDLTEDLIKETHAILCNGVSIIDEELPEVPSEMYAGRYRNVAVGAGSTMFIMPKYVPQRMKELCSSLKEEIKYIETHSCVDPFSLAAKYSLQFVDIHPFQDGNGRMCRIILNVILRRYLGIVVAIGETDEDVREYIGIKRRASMEREGHGEYATFVLKRGTKTIQKLKQKMHGKKA
ncbi:Fido domain-containing protein [Fusarium keratoplasticum]|uniref:Fido domain-containing protein n=1 Tax=Fusarium keratoplasticum TaxID=1328300 RepID=A0ACC0R3L6_9HYPO|nr:Fido domain-containing protein [Fusarium keratoplasticum]KAI8671762.1 Fido domain-containing protein [Fusarium keratoplasticum]